MSLIKENLLPGENGMIFGTNAKLEKEVMKVKAAILGVPGVVEVKVDMEAFPRQLAVFSDVIVEVDDIKKAVVAIGYHAVPDRRFGLG